jgi:hypothetical protein
MWHPAEGDWLTPAAGLGHGGACTVHIHGADMRSCVALGTAARPDLQRRLFMPRINSTLRREALSKKSQHALMAGLAGTLMWWRTVPDAPKLESAKALRIRGRSVARLIMSGLLAAFGAINAQGAGIIEEHPIVTKQTIAVEHVRIESTKSFADVRAALERTLPQLDPSLVKALGEGDVERVSREKKEGPELSIFLVRDHGALLRIAGKARIALQYDIGNPITASLMTRHRLAAALYAPIRVVLYENDSGHGVFEYDLPSTTFGQFGDERVTIIARGLDAALTRALTRAAE